MSTILITHDLGLAATYCDRVTVMEKGHVVETATSRAIFTAPEHPYTRKLMRATPRPGVSLRDLLPEDAERAADRASAAAAAAADKTPLLVVEKLVKEYPRQGAVKSLARAVPPRPGAGAGDVPRGRRHQLHASAAARASGWSASPAAASPPPRPWSCG